MLNLKSGKHSFIPKTRIWEQLFMPGMCLAESPVSDLTDSVMVGTGEGTIYRTWISQVTPCVASGIR